MQTAVVLSWLLSVVAGVASRRVTISTVSAQCDLKISEPGRTVSLSPHPIFRLESALSQLLHSELSVVADANSRVVATSVHLRRTTNDDGAASNSNDSRGTSAATNFTWTLDSVVSVTYSREDTTINNLASELNSVVSSRDLLAALTVVDVFAPDAAVQISCAEFHGSPDERGVSATNADIVPISNNNGWPMFFAGASLTLLVVGIVGVGAWVYRREEGRWPCAKKAHKGGPVGSVHYEGDVDLEVATTATGILGAKYDENRHPTQVHHRKKGRASSATGQTAEDLGSPMTVVSAASKHPLGIAPLGRRDAFRTPQKPKSERVKMYDVARLTRT